MKSFKEFIEDLSVKESILNLHAPPEPITAVKPIRHVGRIHSAIAHYHWKHKKAKHVKEVTIRDAAGHEHQLANVQIRMANGKIKSLPPGKSGSSGGGGK